VDWQLDLADIGFGVLGQGTAELRDTDGDLLATLKAYDRFGVSSDSSAPAFGWAQSPSSQLRGDGVASMTSGRGAGWRGAPGGEAGGYVGHLHRVLPIGEGSGEDPGQDPPEDALGPRDVVSAWVCDSRQGSGP
jgi:hypothetical protein